MKFAVKLKHKGQPSRWDVFDDPRVLTHRDAFAFGVVMAEYWNNDMKPGETRMKILNAQVLGPGKKRFMIGKVDPRQHDLFPNKTSRRLQ